jgi:hypothetical protein
MNPPYQDVTSKGGKVYRIICEDFNLSHPCEAIAVVFDISNPKAPKEMHRETDMIGTSLDTLMYRAKQRVRTLP